ncbi:asparagine synthase-related protein [Pseudoalteromonas sp. DL2-H2.2]|uniref:asparagine synthase-related protein n=1 Tax=Pseudoalteromonas sp. DL2-H2.2 TaxID=2908889 RepID=UPI001F3C3236|nr:asparagine synthase-related protein [Pseudoalteromonas sp. DL2-H2.2]MCF2908844.1 asparagine synthase-related protein [Pseudoalteromonas sp. DL2-H2.2]
MPGIFGFTKENQTVSIESVQNSMMLFPSFKKDDLFEDEFIAASRVHLNKIGEKSSPTQKNDLLVWVEGEAYNHVELASCFGYKEGLSFSECLLFVYQNNLLDDFLNKLDGYFCAAIYDKEKKQVKLISDRYGMRMLYWYWYKGKFAWSSEVKGILATGNIDKAIDSTSFDCFMELGHLLGEKTWFEHIKLIKPATVITLDLQKNVVTQYHYWAWSEISPSSLSFDDAVDELGKRFIKAVERRFNPKEMVGITLSGGLDSRAILAAIEHLYPDYKGCAFTFGIEGCDDIAIAKQVVSQSNWSHKEYHFSEKNWFKPRFEQIWNTDGLKDMMHMHGCEFVGDIAKSIDVNLNGYLGDAIFGGSYFKNGNHLNQRINESIVEKYYRTTLDESFQSDFYDINHIDPYLFMSRGRRFINMGIVNTLVSIEQRTPFFDNQCVELIYSLPDEYRENNKLYSTMLHRFFPKYFKTIIWQQTGKPAGITYNENVISRYLGKISRRLKVILGMKSTQSYTDYNRWIRSPEVSEYLFSILDAETAEYKAITNDDLLKRYFIPHLKSKAYNKSSQVLRAATVEIYLKLLKEKLNY